jgi:3-hydroxyacyl-CoA dehydrogenase
MAERLMELFLKLPLVAVVAAGIMGTGLAFVVKFIVEANQTPHDRIPGVADDASRK